MRDRGEPILSLELHRPTDGSHPYMREGPAVPWYSYVWVGVCTIYVCIFKCMGETTRMRDCGDFPKSLAHSYVRVVRTHANKHSRHSGLSFSPTRNRRNPYRGLHLSKIRLSKMRLSIVFPYFEVLHPQWQVLISGPILSVHNKNFKSESI